MPRNTKHGNTSADHAIFDDLLGLLGPQSPTARRFCEANVRIIEFDDDPDDDPDSAPYRARGLQGVGEGISPDGALSVPRRIADKTGRRSDRCKGCRSLHCKTCGPGIDKARRSATAKYASVGRGITMRLSIRAYTSPAKIARQVKALLDFLGAYWIAYAVEQADDSPHLHLHAIVLWHERRPLQREVEIDRRTSEKVTFMVAPATVEHLDQLAVVLGRVWKLAPASTEDVTDPAIAPRTQWVDTLPGIRPTDLDGNPRDFRWQCQRQAAWYVLRYMSKGYRNRRTRQQHMALLGKQPRSVRLVGIDQTMIDQMAGIR